MEGAIPESAFWGKLERTEEGVVARWHPLVDHCLDVAAVFEALLAVPALRRALETCAASSLTCVHVARLAVLALLHDLGKCNIGFQAKRDNAHPVCGHVLEVRGFFESPDVPKEWRDAVESMSVWFVHGAETLESMLLAAFSHHGRPLSINDIENQAGDSSRWWRKHNGLDPMRGVRELLLTARAAFPQAFESGAPLEAKPELQHRFAGLTMLADWIGSDTQHFPYRENESEDRITLARLAARRALDRLGLQTENWRSDIARRGVDFEAVFGRTPYPLQRYLAQELSIDDDSRVLLVESETGSGKTEAALVWYLRLFAAGKVDGLYLALPTRVAAREMYGRVCSAVASAFPASATRPRPVLLAVPGYARVDGDAYLPDPNGCVWTDDPTDARRETVWAAERPKRFLAAPVAVGTIDQALLSTLQVKHAHLRSVCLDRHLLVVDEVHASDPYMREVLGHLLEQHRARAGWALLLSATLGDAARTHVLRQPLTSLAAARSRAYPLISTAHSKHAPVSPADRDKAVRIEQMEVLTHLEDLVAPIAAALDHGARVLVVMNTVVRANQFLRAVEAGGLVPDDRLFSTNGVHSPHHGRFARADREVLDGAVSRIFGRDSSPGPVLVVGTQTLEQSLDIDADWLISDPCPIDVLLQRLGRLHRHRARVRPRAFAQARALVLRPAEGDFSRFVTARGEGRGPAGIGRVYRDLRMLQRTFDVLRDRPEILLPRDNRLLVEDALHPDALAALDTTLWRRHEAYLEGTLMAELRQAEIGRLNEQPFGECQFRSSDERVVTRLGTSDYRVRLSPAPLSPFGCAINELLIPAHMIHDHVNEEATDVVPGADGFTFAVSNHRFRYCRFGLEKIDA